MKKYKEEAPQSTDNPMTVDNLLCEFMSLQFLYVLLMCLMHSYTHRLVAM